MLRRFALPVGLFLVTVALAQVPTPKQPETPRRPVVETLHGQAITDDFRWLEDATRADVRKWLTAQNRHTRTVLDATPLPKQVQDRLTEVLLPADGDLAGIEHMIATISHAVRGQETFDDLVVRPAREWGIRWFTRVGPCTAPSAALIVLDPGD